jgi:hypothetical protein
MRLRPSLMSLTLASIIVTAFVLRVIGVQYGLPGVYNPDEVAIMARSLAFAKGTLNPGNFLYPTFYFYVLFGWVGSYLGWVWLTGGVASIGALQDLYFTSPTGIYTAGRLLSVVCGTLTVPAVYALGKRIFSVQIGLVAALFLAVAPLAVRDSHYVKHDIPVTLTIVIAHIAIVRLWPSVRSSTRVRNDVMLAAAACAIAFSTHYYSIFLVLPLTFAVVQRTRAESWTSVVRHLALAAMICTVVFFALSPFILVEPVTAWRDITANREIVIDRAVRSGAFGPADQYLNMLWNDSMGRAAVAVAIAGAACMVVVIPARATLLLLFPVSFFLFITNTAPASRYLNPLLPFLALFAAWMLDYVRTALRAPSFATGLVAVLFALPPAIDSVRTDLFIRTDDTRTLARRFIEQSVPSGASILIQPYSVPLTPSRDSIEDALRTNVGGVEQASRKFQIQLGLDPYPSPAYRLLWLGRGGLDADKIYVDPARLAGPQALPGLERLGVTYVILKRYNMEDSDLRSFAAELSRRGRLIAAFSPYRPETSEAERARTEPFLHNTDTRIERALARPGPSLEIWQIHGPDS